MPADNIPKITNTKCLICAFIFIPKDTIKRALGANDTKTNTVAGCTLYNSYLKGHENNNSS